MRLTEAINTADSELKKLSAFELKRILDTSIEYDTFRLTLRIQNIIKNKKNDRSKD